MRLNNGILFVCSQNAARSQIAHGWLKHLTGDRFRVYSAGVRPGELHEMAVDVMAEVGIDIAYHLPEGIDRYLGKVPVHTLITVCERAALQCPRYWPGSRVREAWHFDDPAAATGSDEERRAVFRRVRDEIRNAIEAWLERQDQETDAVTA